MEVKREIQVGLLGFGTVGTGVLRIIQQHQDDLVHQTGCSLHVKKVLVQSIEKPRALEVNEDLMTTNPEDLLFDPDIDIIIEVMGGIDLARGFMLRPWNSESM
jgi:homoserine dehydrogenase